MVVRMYGEYSCEKNVKKYCFKQTLFGQKKVVS